MKKIFVNLKRFDVPREIGGICPMNNPKEWIGWIMDESVKNGLGKLEDMEVTFLLPEGLVISAVEKLATYSEEVTRTINIGIQGVFRENVIKGGNFGAFTTNCPASAAKNMGSSWVIIGHSEEREDKFNMISRYDIEVLENKEKQKAAKASVDGMINEEVLCALDSGIKVLLCIGETAEEKGDGEFEEQKPRVELVLRAQLENGLEGVINHQPQKNVVIGYEPIWAIGPGKTPPGAEYIAFISACIKKICIEKYNFDPVVVYGGGLKEENAGMISKIDTIGGGLVALTRFTGDIGFYPDELKRIVNSFN